MHFDQAVTRQALYDLGFTKRDLQTAAAEGSLMPIGRTWLARPDADAQIVTALRAGGILGGASALRSYGIWVTERPALVDVATVPHRPRSKMQGIRRLWQEHEADVHNPWRVTVHDALAQYLPKTGRLNGIATLDSALHQGYDLTELRSRLPERCRSWLDETEPLAESGTESLVRVSGRDRGWQVEAQVPFEGGRLDNVIEGWLCVESDSKAWHGGEEQYDRDHRRNHAVLRAGGRWHRVSYADVVHNLEHTMQLIEQIVRQGNPTRLNR